MSSDSESGSSYWESAHPELQAKGVHVVGAPQAPEVWVLVLVEDRHTVRTTTKDEYILHNNFDIQSFVTLYFQDPATRTINGVEVTLYKKMFMAGLRLPFPTITRELMLFLNVAPSQIVPNGWRYLFASYSLWPTVLMSAKYCIFGPLIHIC
jgi:hypothetical protein